MKTVRGFWIVILISIACIVNAYAVEKENDLGRNLLEKTGKVVAKVLNKEIFSSEIQPSVRQIEINKKQLSQENYKNWLICYRNDRLNGYVFGVLLAEYEKKHDCEPTPEE